MGGERDSKRRRQQYRISSAIADLSLRLEGHGPKWRILKFLAVAIPVTFVVGFVGWLLAEPLPGEEDLDVWTALYRTIALFRFDGSGNFPAPWTVQVTRFVAPLLTIVLTATVIALVAWAVRNTATASRDHVVVVGDVAHSGLYLPLRSEARRTQTDPEETGPSSTRQRRYVHVVADSSERERCDGHHIHVIGESGWIAESAALEASRVVLATGDDMRNYELLGELVGRTSGDEESDPGPADLLPAVQVQIEHTELAQWLAIECAVERPERSIDVLLRSEEVAHRAGRLLLGVGSEDATALERTTLVLVGGSEDADLEYRVLEVVRARLGEIADKSFNSWNPTLSLIGFRAAIPAPDISAERVLVEQLAISRRGSLEAPGPAEEAEISKALADRLAGDDPGHTVRIVMVGDRCSELAMRALQTAALRPDARVWMTSGDGQSPFSNVDPPEPGASGGLNAGLWANTAGCWSDLVDDKAPAARSTSDPTEGATRRLRALRHVLSMLVRDEHFRVSASPEPPLGSRPCHLLSDDVADRVRGVLEETGAFEAEQARVAVLLLPRALRFSGFSLFEPVEAATR